MTVVVLTGGTGGAKLARGLYELLGDELVVIANTGDDTEIHGGHVAPDPDLVTFHLAGSIDERGWGLAGDTFAVMEELERLGEDVWFRLGDRDLALCLARARRLAAGERLTAITEELARANGVRARVLPMCDEPVRTWVDGEPFQEWMIRGGGRDGRAVEHVEFRGRGTVSPEVAEALAAAERIIVGPSNPVISIGPILAVLGEALRAAPAPVIGVSPIVGGEVLKGPTADFLAWAGAPATSAGVAAHYGDLLDGWVADVDCPGVPTLVCDVDMPDVAAATRLARDVVGFAP